MTLAPEFQKIKESFNKQYGPQGDARFTQWVQQNRYTPTLPIATQKSETSDKLNTLVDSLFCELHEKPIRAHEEAEILWDLYLVNLLVDVLDKDLLKDVFVEKEKEKEPETDVESDLEPDVDMEPDEDMEPPEEHAPYDVSGITPPKAKKPKSKRKSKAPDDTIEEIEDEAEDEDEGENEDEAEDEDEDEDESAEDKMPEPPESTNNNTVDKPIEKIGAKLYKDITFIASALYTNGLYYLPVGGVPAYHSFGPTPVLPDQNPLADVKSVLKDVTDGLEPTLDWYLNTVTALQEINDNFEQFMESSHFNDPKSVTIWKEAHKTLKAWHEVVSMVSDELNSRFQAVQLHLGPTVGYDITPEGVKVNPMELGWRAPDWEVVSKDALINMLNNKDDYFVRAYQPAEYNVTIQHFKEGEQPTEETKRMSYGELKEVERLIQTKSGAYHDAVIADVKPLPDAHDWLVNYSIKYSTDINLKRRQRRAKQKSQAQDKDKDNQGQALPQPQPQAVTPATPEIAPASGLPQVTTAIKRKLSTIESGCSDCSKIAEYVASRKKYPWPKCIKDQLRRYGSLKIARKVCGFIKHHLGHGEEGSPTLYECECGEVGDEDTISKHVYEEHLHKDEQYNPWAICRSMQKKHGWSDEKTERCIKEVKAKVGWKSEEDEKEEEEDRTFTVNFGGTSYIVKENIPLSYIAVYPANDPSNEWYAQGDDVPQIFGENWEELDPQKIVEYLDSAGALPEPSSNHKEEQNDSTSESPYHRRQPCPWCDKIFDSWSELADHINSLHKHEEGAKDIIDEIMKMAEDLEQENKIYKMFPHI